MVGPLLSVKHRRPSHRPGAVARRRLAERLAAATGSAVTVISAPAGFGKTTLLAEWLAATDVDEAAVAWLSLDRGDNEAVLFWTYVVRALHTVVDGLGAGALQVLASSSPSVDTALAALLNDLDGLSRDVVLVLDDYHLVEAPEIHEAMTFLLEHRPPRLHLVFATRADPPLPLAHLRARGQLVEIRAADLRFTREEAAQYLGAMGLELSEADVAALEQRTEGWAAALQLAALSLQGRENATAFIAGFAGDDRFVVDYLVEEVLARLPADVRDFLLRTSIVAVLTGPLCDALTGGEGGRATLVALEAANLFLVPLDDRRQWYRYHHLFADVLRAHLIDERPDELAGLHGRASAWFAAHDDTSSAIEHALAAGDTARAAELMELAMPVMRRERREAEMARWLRSLPDDVVRTRPVLDVAFAGALAQASRFDLIGARLDRIEARVRAADGTWLERPPPDLVVIDQDHYRSLPAHVEMYRAALALAGGDLASTIAHAREALSLAPETDALARAAAGALGGLASWTTGDLAGAHAAYTESVAGLAGAGFRADVLGCTITLGDIRRTQGQLGAALRTYRDALESAEAPSGTEPLRGTADMHVGIAGVLVERNDLTAAHEQLAISHGLGEHKGLPQNPYRWRVVMARLRAAEGELDDALALLDDAERVYVGDFAPDVQPVPAVRARLRLRRGEIAPAEDWARDRRLTVDDGPSYLREYEHLTLARLLIARHRAGRAAAGLDDALALLGRLLGAAQLGGRGASVLEILILQSLAHDAVRDTPAALAALGRAVVLAQPEGYVRLFLDEGTAMAALLTTLGKRPGSPAYVKRLRAATPPKQSRRAGPPELLDPLSERELDVLRLLGGDLDGPDIARALSVSLNTLRTHTKNIYAKLGVTSRRAAVSQGRDLGLIPGPRHS